MKSQFVLDAWAVLALLQKEEPAAARVKSLLEKAAEHEVELFISIINLGEVIYRISRMKGEKEAQETLHLIRRLPLTVLPADEGSVFSAVGFKMRFAISYADAFAVAAAVALDAMLVTGDPELDQFEDQVQILKLQRTV